ncbi:MAG TPA: glycosyltransferase [Stenotrophomonas sp.]|nr:glycosyltransferase [Stenotrophomonas sp.]
MVVMLATAGPAERLRETLKSLSECQFPEAFRETIVIENGPRSGIGEILAEQSDVLRIRHVYVPEPNKSIALNQAIEALDDCFIYFIDDDVRFGPQVLMEYAAAAQEKPGFYFGGPTSVDYEARPPEWLIPYLPPSARGWSPSVRWVSPRRALEMNACEACVEGVDLDVPVFRGFNWAAFSADLKRAGGFNPERGPGARTNATGQEMDMQSRLIAIGVKGKYLSRARVWHYVPRSRCTPQWTLQRAYRDGVGRGISEKQADTFLGFPITMLARVIALLSILLMTRSKYDPVARFELRLRVRYLLGYRKGLRLRRDRPLPAEGHWNGSVWCTSCRS